MVVVFPVRAILNCVLVHSTEASTLAMTPLRDSKKRKKPKTWDSRLCSLEHKQEIITLRGHFCPFAVNVTPAKSLCLPFVFRTLVFIPSISRGM